MYFGDKFLNYSLLIKLKNCFIYIMVYARGYTVHMVTEHVQRYVGI